MILVDTSVWVDHLRSNDAALSKLLEQCQVLTHPFVIGELSLGNLKQREVVLDALHGLPQAMMGNEDEVQHFISAHALFERGIGYIDVHLLASVQLTPGTTLWTRDKRLLEAAQALSLSSSSR